jgi:transposase
VPSKSRKQFTPGFKAKVALEAIRGERTASEIGRTYSIHPNLVGIWKRQALEGLPEIFSNPRQQRHVEDNAEKDELYRKIGQLKVELDWLKKKSGLPD